MTQQNTIARAMHDIGGAAWFGGSLMGAIGLNGAAASVERPGERTKVASAGWARWTPANLAAILAHLAGGAVLLSANRGRVAGQQGVGSATSLKTALTVAALGATAYSRKLGQTVMNNGSAPAVGATEPSDSTPADVADAQRKLKTLQWIIPALTGAILVVSSRMGEQQRPATAASGFLSRLNPAA